jgi:hypothetical protein
MRMSLALTLGPGPMLGDEFSDRELRSAWEEHGDRTWSGLPSGTSGPWAYWAYGDVPAALRATRAEVSASPP